MAKEQKLAEKIGNIVYETHVYGSPEGPGYIDFEYQKQGNKLERKATHVGPSPSFSSYDFTEIPDVDTVFTEIVGSHVVPDQRVVKKVVDPVTLVVSEIVVLEDINVPDYGLVTRTVKHPYKDQFFGS